MVKISDLAETVVILFVGGGIGVVIFLHLGITLPILEHDVSKFLGFTVLSKVKFLIRHFVRSHP